MAYQTISDYTVHLWYGKASKAMLKYLLIHRMLIVFETFVNFIIRSYRKYEPATIPAIGNAVVIPLVFIVSTTVVNEFVKNFPTAAQVHIFDEKFSLSLYFLRYWIRNALLQYNTYNILFEEMLTEIPFEILKDKTFDLQPHLFLLLWQFSKRCWEDCCAYCGLLFALIFRFEFFCY